MSMPQTPAKTRQRLRQRLQWYIGQNLEAISQIANVLTGGYADEMLCARMHRCRHRQPEKTGRWVFNRIFYWQEDHCHAMYVSEWYRKGQHSHYGRHRDQPSASL